MALRDYLPIPKLQVEEKKQATIDGDDQKAIKKAMKIAALALGSPTSAFPVGQRKNFESSPYNFPRIIQAADTDSYVKQAFSKYGELFWKEGWDIVGENPEAVDYLWQRIDYFEIAMNRPFQDFLDSVADNLFKFHNCFIVKSRGDLNEFFPTKLEGLSDKDPVIGYYVLPTEQVEIVRDKNNQPRWYRQRTDIVSSSSSIFTASETKFPQWKAEEVIHLYRDKKDGRAFGTPFINAALDDVIAVRQLEEDAQNVCHREVFPFYKYKIGTDDHPASDEEVEKARVELESMRSEGGLIMPHRHDVEVIGGEGKALDISAYMIQFKERLATGLGLYPHHLGMTAQVNRDATDRLDTALYDRIKKYQRYFADAIRFYMFNEILMEGGFDPTDNPKEKGTSDRCTMRFSEIDVDTQVKKDANAINKATSGMQTIPEARMDMRMKPDMDEAQTVQAMQVRMQPDSAVQSKNKDGSPGQPKLVDTTPAAAKGQPNAKRHGKGASNIIRPTNQHGTRTSPNIRHEDDDWLREVVELLDPNPIQED